MNNAQELDENNTNCLSKANENDDVEREVVAATKDEYGGYESVGDRTEANWRYEAGQLDKHCQPLGIMVRAQPDEQNARAHCMNHHRADKRAEKHLVPETTYLGHYHVRRAHLVHLWFKRERRILAPALLCLSKQSRAICN